MIIKYQYAYDKDKNIINIKNAIKSIFYYCIGCSNRLIAKQGKIKKWHFAHKNGEANCSFESYLHQTAKEKFCKIYNDCLKNNKPFYLQIEEEFQYKECDCNAKFNICQKCDYKQIKSKNIDITKWFKNIEIEKSIENFRADICLSTIDKTENIFIEIHVTNKISDNKRDSKYRIIEIDIDNEDDLNVFEEKLLIQSEKIRFYNFKTPKKMIPNDEKCPKKFTILFLKKDGNVNFKNNLNISQLNKIILNNKDNWQEYHTISNELLYNYDIQGPCVYKFFIADCAKKNYNIKNCFICRYRADACGLDLPIFCKFLKKGCRSTEAINCKYFKKEAEYIEDYLLESNYYKYNEE